MARCCVLESCCLAGWWCSTNGGTCRLSSKSYGQGPGAARADQRLKDTETVCASVVVYMQPCRPAAPTAVMSEPRVAPHHFRPRPYPSYSDVHTSSASRPRISPTLCSSLPSPSPSFVVIIAGGRSSEYVALLVYLAATVAAAVLIWLLTFTSASALRASRLSVVCTTICSSSTQPHTRTESIRDRGHCCVAPWPVSA